MRSRNAAALDHGVASGEFLAQPALDPMGHRVNHVIVDLIGDLLRKMRGSIRHPLARERRGVLGAEKYRAHGGSEY